MHFKLAIARLRDRVTSDAMDADERKSVEDYQPHITIQLLVNPKLKS